MSEEEVKAEQSEDADSSTESPTLETEVEAKLAAMRGEVVEKVDETLSETDEKVDPSDSTDTEQPDSDDEKTDDAASLLPSGHRRAAVARGWTNEEVDHFLSTKPEEATKEFGEIFNDWQKENSRWSDRGRQLHDAGVEKKTEVKPEESKDVLTHVDTKALIEAHGNDELINALAGPVNATIDRLNAVAEKMSHSEDFLRQTEEETLVAVVQDFLGSKDMKSSEGTYGVDVKTLTEEQVSSRMKLFEQADIIAAGAADHGRDITAREALERAHILLSQGTRDEIIRQGIRDSMEKRTKTTKSSHRQTAKPDANQPISEEELEKRVEAGLEKLRGK